jgi:hypothetical protein
MELTFNWEALVAQIFKIWKVLQFYWSRKSIRVFTRDGTWALSSATLNHYIHRTTLFLCVLKSSNQHIFLRSCSFRLAFPPKHCMHTRILDRLCGLVLRLPGCRPRGPGFDSGRYQVFWVTVGLERDPVGPCEDKWGATWNKKVADPA